MPNNTAIVPRLPSVGSLRQGGLPATVSTLAEDDHGNTNSESHEKNTIVLPLPLEHGEEAMSAMPASGPPADLARVTPARLAPCRPVGGASSQGRCRSRFVYGYDSRPDYNSWPERLCRCERFLDFPVWRGQIGTNPLCRKPNLQNDLRQKNAADFTSRHCIKILGR